MLGCNLWSAFTSCVPCPECDRHLCNFRNVWLISQVHRAAAHLYTCANCQQHYAVADLHQVSPVPTYIYRCIYTGTYIQVQIVRFIVLWQMSQLMICLSKMKLVTGIMAASITTLEIELVLAYLCSIHIHNVNVLHLSKISKCYFHCSGAHAGGDWSNNHSFAQDFETWNSQLSSLKVLGLLPRAGAHAGSD